MSLWSLIAQRNIGRPERPGLLWLITRLALVALASGCGWEGEPTSQSITPSASADSSPTQAPDADTWTLRGRVDDLLGRPLAGVTVTVQGAAPTLTGGDGVFTVYDLPLPEPAPSPTVSPPGSTEASPGAVAAEPQILRVTATLEGYAPTQRIISAPAGSTFATLSITLARLSSLSLTPLDGLLRGAADDGLLIEVDSSSLSGPSGELTVAPVTLRWALATETGHLAFAPEDGVAELDLIGLAWLELRQGEEPLTLGGEALVCVPTLIVPSTAMNVLVMKAPETRWAWQDSGPSDLSLQIPCVTFKTSALGAVAIARQPLLTCACDSQFYAGQRVQDPRGNRGVVLCARADSSASLRVAWDGSVEDEDGEGCLCPDAGERAALPTAGARWVGCERARPLTDGGYPCSGSCWDHDGDGSPLGEDCDDADPDLAPGLPEVCDGQGKDEDCDGSVDEGLAVPMWIDADGDGYGDSEAEANSQCPGTAGYALTNADCDDTERVTRPGGVESCDDKDNDCDGAVDEATTVTVYLDCDRDGFGLPESAAEVCDASEGAALPEWEALCADAASAAGLLVGGDCDDSSAAVHPAAIEACDGRDEDCDGRVDEGAQLTWYPDQDGDGFGGAGETALACELPDGYASASDDCDDGDGSIAPGAAEAADGVDQDCDGVVDEDSPLSDDDGDGHCEVVSGCLGELPGGDCDDGDPGVSPSGGEASYEEDVPCASVNASLPSANVSVNASSLIALAFSPERSGSARRVEIYSRGAGTTATAALWEADPISGAPLSSLATSGAFTLGGALGWYGRDWRSPVRLIGGGSYYLVFEFTDGGRLLPVAAASEGAVATPHCFGSRSGEEISWSCGNSGLWQLRLFCDGCDGVDGDCDGATDEGVGGESWPDLDGDGYGDGAAAPASGCPRPDAYVPNDGDCDDGSAAIHPAAAEISASGVDEDCDGQVDEDGSDATPAPCVNVELGSAVGQPAYSGTTLEASDSQAPSTSCTFGEGGADLTLSWVAPDAGTYTFDTYGSSFDTVLYALTGCGGGQLACNDDSSPELGIYTSGIQLSVASGDRALLVLDGYSRGERGDFVLNISRLEP